MVSSPSWSFLLAQLRDAIGDTYENFCEKELLAVFWLRLYKEKHAAVSLLSSVRVAPKCIVAVVVYLRGGCLKLR